ncbi:LamB/YcsF family protein (plasmid) [Deinococcus psychrotolerans]|uniref:5-oxoprolinase subunit A n=1 Tax=Deinococcus psychrotolerans TaxID=2489213 RepID=A0A3G8YIC7_9DEIO|nr:5-oxoprolinase subunit PxpA [Deinococcus psychrotolerans]AZI44733.1 LamB/YcsF family protein [Deinococcus psychrotolerans]
MSKTIDLNADAGESYGAWTLGDDAALFPLLSSVNIACGFHAGDPLTMQSAVALAKQHGLGIGAHPSYPDLAGFGRRVMEATPEQVYADCLYQISALSGMAQAAGSRLQHVKAHGALSNRACVHAPTAQAIAQATRDFDSRLPLMVLPSTELDIQARALGVPVVLETFPERAYLKDGRLAPRSMAGSSIHDPKEAARRAVMMVLEGLVEAVDGGFFECKVDSLCIHGDNPNAVQIAHAIRNALEDVGVTVRSFAKTDL